MIISDSIRQEAMPEMVYAICKMALKKPKKNQMRRMITLDTDGESASQFNKVYQFAISCGFIKEAGNEMVATDFTEEELSTFRRFRYAILSNVFSTKETAFTTAAKWYLSQDLPQNLVKGQSVFSLVTGAEFVQAMPKELNIDENFVYGFRFWMTALGLTSFSAIGAGSSARPLLFATHRAIGDWLEFRNRFQREAFIPAREFFTKMREDLPVFSNCIEGNMVKPSLSSGLRVLESCGKIELKRVTDAGDVWHLTNSVYYSKSNDITDVIIKEGHYVD